MMRIIFKAVCLLLPATLLAQSTDNRSESYVQLYGGWGIQGPVNTEQTGIAHKRGDFNEFDTDFDLHVKVDGKSDVANVYTTGIVMGHLWTKNERKWNPGFELDLSRTYGKFKGMLANPEDEEVHRINGPNGAEVIEFVHEHYGAGHHTFSNTMNIEAWNLSGNFILTLAVRPKASLYTGFGFGFSGVSLTDAQSIQTSPAQTPPGYETTIDNGGGPVNHFNGQPNASSMLIFGQARLGIKIDLSNKIALLFDTRAFYRGKSDFTFGSTQYSDHAPTSHWNYSISKGTGMMLNVGVMFWL